MRSILNIRRQLRRRVSNPDFPEGLMVVTVLKADVEEGRAEELVGQFSAVSDSLPAPIVEAFLLREMQLKSELPVST